MDLTSQHILLAGGTVVLVTLVIMLIVYRLFGQWVIHRHNIQYRMELTDVFVTLEFIIKVETDLYETYLANNGQQTDYTTLTNTEFINIYRDLSNHCLRAVSSELWRMGELYMSRESLETYVTQKVYSYLADKVPDQDTI